MIKNEFSKSINWGTFTINVAPSFFTRTFFSTNLDIFWTNIVEKHVSENQHIFFLFKLKWSSGESDSLGRLQKLNKEDKDYILEKIIYGMVNRGDYYEPEVIISLEFQSSIREGRALKEQTNINTSYPQYPRHKLPITMDPLKYGKLMKNIGNIFVMKVNQKNIAIITQKDDVNEVEFFISGELKYKYTDRKVNNSIIVRTLDNKQFTFREGKLVPYKVEDK
jgi:hypothetical protein